MALARNLDIDLLRTLLTVAETGNVTRAAERLLRTQSAVSQQLQRLEALAGKQLLRRTSRSLALTADGEALIGYAREILRLNDDALGHLAGPTLAGTVRLGTPEDFATTHLPGVLAEFVQAHPAVALEVTCDLTLNLQQAFRAGQFDLVLVKREPGVRHGGVRVWREPLVWVSQSREFVRGREVLPLALSPEPCVYRKRATTALRRDRRTWRIAYTCASLAGTLAAVRAGLGMTVLPREMVPSGLVAIDDPRLLPDLDDTEIALLGGTHLTPPAALLREHIAHALEAGLWQGSGSATKPRR